MAPSRLRACARVGLTLWLIAAAGGPLAARDVVMKFPNATSEPIGFDALTGWNEDDQAAAFAAFRKSCHAILNATEALRAARPVYGALYKVCQRAQVAGALDTAAARAFFESNFKPMRVTPAGEPGGFFTGYYETEIEGSRVRSPEYPVPLYGKPADLVSAGDGKFVRKGGTPYYDRTEIENGALAGQGLEICWVKNPVDAFFAQIQGSTRVKLTDGTLLRLNYVATNGFPYTAVGKFLIERGAITREAMSMDRIRQWMEANPREAVELRRKNRAFVFFRESKLAAHEPSIGAQGVPLTAGRSVAVDRNIHVYGTPIWIDAALPIESEQPMTAFRHLMVAQDTGTAIIGAARADIFFGTGEAIGHIAGRVKQHGTFVVLVPQAAPTAVTVKR